MSTILTWISGWVRSQCNGDWEHMYGINIGISDNPGWHVTIDLAETNLENIEMVIQEDKTEYDWYFVKVKNKEYFAAGDLTKLELLLEKFKELVEMHPANS
ncbi:Imm53 family immunity protein [Chitinophaga sancti]|uniref:Imm53 family immunity protein n=1 Tax=Chitinophaga sancti TaxID=1004 RepID=UPI002A75DB90|nr:Imm53 family immunity protein [Chitinophaga sancti]WPQ65181.1 Imm53 family immunity protein [Chitinophaga sancti]